MSVRLPAALSVVCAAFVLPPPLQQPTFRASVEVVRVDVLATSRGVPIEGLTAADFELLDNGVPQVIDAVFAESEALDV